MNYCMDDEGARYLADALKTNSTLQTLYIDYSSIGTEGARHLADALKTNSTLQTLHAGGNKIGDEGTRHLAEALNMLQTLDLWDSEIGAEGARHLADALKTNSTLQTLQLERNKIGDEGTRHLADALKTNSTLQTLNLSDENDISAEGAQYLADALKTNSTLQTLILTSNNISDEGARALLEALQTNEALRELGLSPNGIADELMAEIEARVTVVQEQVRTFTRDARDALNGNKVVRWGRAKLMLVGNGAAGKTSLVRSLLGETPVTTHLSTQGAELTQTRTRDWTKLRADQSDLPEHLARRVFQQRKSLTLRISKRLGQALKNASSLGASNPSPDFALDEKDVAAAYSAPLKQHVQRRGSKVEHEISFTIWDYGGQEVFYALHHLFLTEYGAYLVVFDMREVVGKERFARHADVGTLADKEKALAMLRFWLDSIALHAPSTKVLLVGTRMDTVDTTDLATVDAELQRGLGVNKSKQVVRNGNDNLWFFPVDNLEREDMSRVDRVRTAVTKAVQDTDFVTRKVPLRWTLAMDKLLAHRGRSRWTVAEVQALAETACGIAPEEARTQMLPFLHELGVVVHFGTSQSATLRDLVVTRPQWLLDQLSRVICEPRHMVTHIESLREEVPPTLREDMVAWEERAIVSKGLMAWLWRDRDVDYLVDLMEEMLLASALNSQRTSFLVPSLLPSATDELKQAETARVAGGVLCWFGFDFLPKGVFQRFICSFARQFDGDDYTGYSTLRADLAVLFAAEVEVLLTMDYTLRRVDVRFAASDGAQVYAFVKLLFDIFRGVSERFMKGRLGAELVLSADGSHDDSACVTYAKYLAAVASSSKASAPSLRTGKFVRLSALRHFCKPAKMLQRAESTMTSRGFDVFVSYCHESEAHIARVAALAHGLKAAGLSVWWDKECMMPGAEDVEAAMANGIRDSSVFLVIVTRAYADKVNMADGKNLHLEFRQGVEARPMVAAVMDATMRERSARPIGIFTFKLGDPFYVDMVADVDVQRNMPALVTAIRNKLS